MIRHLVIWRYRPGADPEQCRQLVRAMSEYPQHFPSMQNFRLTKNMSERDTRYSHVLMVEFPSERELREYLNSPMHSSLAKRSREVMDDRIIVTVDDAVSVEDTTS
jgi:uncharacterized protein (DUF1330 family)